MSYFRRYRALSTEIIEEHHKPQRNIKLYSNHSFDKQQLSNSKYGEQFYKYYFRIKIVFTALHAYLTKNREPEMKFKFSPKLRYFFLNQRIDSNQLNKRINFLRQMLFNFNFRFVSIATVCARRIKNDFCVHTCTKFLSSHSVHLR